MQKHKVIAAILAGGTGTRMGSLEPKQFLFVGEKMVIEMSVEAFERNRHVDEIIIVSHPDHIDRVHEIVRRNGWQKVSRVVPGGKERWQSSWAAIEACDELKDNDVLLFHDAARPFVSQDTIFEVVTMTDYQGAAAAGVAATDTVWQVVPTLVRTEWPEINQVPDRSLYYLAQTPQGFHYGVVREAYRRAQEASEVLATDDVGIVRRYLPDQPILVAHGTTENKKITYPQDLIQ